MRQHGYNCTCDICMERYNARSKKYNEEHLKGRKFGESFEDFEDRIRRSAQRAAAVVDEDTCLDYENENYPTWEE